MRWTRGVRPLGMLALMFTHGLSVQAETLTGTVVDPQQRVIVGARVSLACGRETGTRRTDREGSFTFTRQVFPEDCKIRVEHPGFAPLELAAGKRRSFLLALKIAELRQTVEATGGVLSLHPLASVSLTAQDLKTISDKSGDLIAYAKQLAGAQSGSDHIYVDGMAADHPPPADRIETISINPDPFSAEYSDAGDTHIEIVTKKAERKYRLSSGGISLGPGAPNGLNPHLRSSSNTATFGLVGPVPRLPLAFTTDISISGTRGEVPIEALVPEVRGGPMSSASAARASSSRGLIAVGADYSKEENLRVNTSFYLGTGKRSNVNVGGLTLPDAGLRDASRAHEIRSTFTRAGQHYIYRGGFTADWSNADLSANRHSLGVAVSGAFTGGGAGISDEKTEGTRWTLKNVLEVSQGKHYWSTGATVSRSADVQTIIPNPAGVIQFASLEDYVMSAETGAPTGTATITRGQGAARYASYTAAPFLQTEVFRSTRLSVRGGLRGDYQTAGSILLSPRLSMVTVLHGFILRAGNGMFVQDWRNNVFLRVLENDGHHLEPYLITNACLSDMEGGTPTLGRNIISRVAPNLAARRDWISKFSVERPFKNFLPGVEYTFTSGTRLLGSERPATPTGWTDTLESNRVLSKQQLHFRAQYKLKGQGITAHYEWIRSFDNTDGPFSFPANQSDLRAEWARSTGISPHNLAMVGNFQLPGGFSVYVIGSLRSPAPFNITTGADPTRDGLFNDRGGVGRNSGVGPAYRAVSLYAYKRVRVARFSAESKRSFYANLGLQADNLLGNRNAISFDSVRNSPLFGQALAALPGRSVRIWLNFSQ